MKVFLSPVLGAVILSALSWSGLQLCDASAAASDPQTSIDPKPQVYVSDFEIGVVSTAPVNKPEEDPRRQASRLVDWMSSKLVIALQKAGYGATRMHPGDPRPDTGVGIRGLFAEVDGENHWRRAIVRSVSDGGKMQALVAVTNLAKPDQALYEIAPLPGNEDRPGAVITLSPYVPLTKYDLNKDADENVFKVMAPKIVNDLTFLLNHNPSAFPK